MKDTETEARLRQLREHLTAAQAAQTLGGDPVVNLDVARSLCAGLLGEFEREHKAQALALEALAYDAAIDIPRDDGTAPRVRVAAGRLIVYGADESRCVVPLDFPDETLVAMHLLGCRSVGDVEYLIGQVKELGRQ